MAVVCKRSRFFSSFGIVELLGWGATLGVFFVGMQNPSLPCFSKINPALALGLVCGLGGGFIVGMNMLIIIAECHGHAEMMTMLKGNGDLPSKAGAKYVACISFIVATKLVALASAFFVTVGCFSLCLNSEMGVMHLDRIGSIAMMVTGIVFAAVAIIAPQLILSFAASDCGKVGPMIAATHLEHAACVMVFSAPISAVAAIAYKSQI